MTMVMTTVTTVTTVTTMTTVTEAPKPLDRDNLEERDKSLGA